MRLLKKIFTIGVLVLLPLVGWGQCDSVTIEADFDRTSRIDSLTPNGTINVTPSGGTAPYTYLWSNAETTQSISELDSGWYGITITDAIGCTLDTITYVNYGVPLNTVYDDEFWANRDAGIASYDCPEATNTTWFPNGIVYIDPTQLTNGVGTEIDPFNELPSTLTSHTAYLFKRGTTDTVGDDLRRTVDNVLIGAYGTGERPNVRATRSFRLTGDSCVFRDIANTVGGYSCGGYPYSDDIHNWVYKCEIKSMAMYPSFSFVVGNDIHGSAQDGIWSAGTTEGHYVKNIEVSYNHVYDINSAWNPGADMGVGQGDCAQIYATDTAWVHHNLFDRNNTANKFCLLVGSEYDPVRLQTFIYNNVFYSPRESIYGGGCVYLYTATDPTLTNNVFLNAHDDGGMLSMFSTEEPIMVGNFMKGVSRAFATGSYVYNNTIIDVPDLNLTYVARAYGNIFSGSHVDYTGNTDSNLWVDDVAGGIDAIFTDADNDDYTLIASSPAVDSGFNDVLSLWNVDMLGTSVPQNSRVDMGAFEYAVATWCSENPITYTSVIENDTTPNNTGGAIITIESGESPYTYLWSSGETVNYIEDKAYGTYTCFITDDSLCTKLATIVIPNVDTSTTPPPIEPPITNVDTIKINMTQDPFIKNEWINVTTSNYSDEVVDVVTSGDYVYDNGLTVDGWNDTVSAKSIKGSPTYTNLSVRITFNGDVPDSVDLYVLSSDDSESVGQWVVVNNADSMYITPNNIENSEGIFTGVEVIGDSIIINGFTDPYRVYFNGFKIVPYYSAPCETTTIAPTASIVSAPSGSIFTTPSGGTSPYTYLWSNSATTKDIKGLNQGEYSIVITDDNTCVGYDTFYVDLATVTLDTIMGKEIDNKLGNWSSKGNLGIDEYNERTSSSLDKFLGGRKQNYETICIIANEFIRQFPIIANDTLDYTTDPLIPNFKTRLNAAIFIEAKTE